MRMEEYVIKNQKKLRLGITTGTCSAAAARAAAMQLLLGVESHAVTLRTPKGMTVSVPVYLLEADALLLNSLLCKRYITILVILIFRHGVVDRTI